jgi:glycerol kinase
MAAVGSGLYPTLGEAADSMRGKTVRFTPQIDEARRSERLERWRKALLAA